MSRHLALTAVEAQAFAATPVGETFWLVREGDTLCGALGPIAPAEFVQVCAFCNACDARLWDHGQNRKTDCPDCRIELVGECPTCAMPSGDAEPCYLHVQPNGTVTLGHAYAEGQPLPIAWEDDFSPEWQVSHNPIVIVTNERRPVTMPWPKVLAWHDPDAEPVGIDLTAAVAHCGPPETLVGQWAIALRRVQA